VRKKTPQKKTLNAIKNDINYNNCPLLQEKNNCFYTSASILAKIAPKLASFSAEQRFLGQFPALFVCRRK